MPLTGFAIAGSCLTWMITPPLLEHCAPGSNKLRVFVRIAISSSPAVTIQRRGVDEPRGDCSLTHLKLWLRDLQAVADIQHAGFMVGLTTVPIVVRQATPSPIHLRHRGIVDRPYGSLRPVADVNLSQNRLDMNLDGRFGDVEPAGYHLVRCALDKTLQDIMLAA